MKDKKFFWKDKSGRGFTQTFSLNAIRAGGNERSWDDEPLKKWAREAEVGDVWENATDHYTRIK